MDRPPAEWIREALVKAPVEEAPLTVEVALASRALVSKHRDPADRFLVATAQIFDLTLVTADRVSCPDGGRTGTLTAVFPSSRCRQ